VRRKAGARATRWGPGVVARAGESVSQLWAASELPGLVPLVAMRRRRHPWACVGGDVRRAEKSVQGRAPGGFGRARPWQRTSPCPPVVPRGGEPRAEGVARTATGAIRAARVWCSKRHGREGGVMMLKKTWARVGGHGANQDMGASGGGWC